MEDYTHQGAVHRMESHAKAALIATGMEPIDAPCPWLMDDSDAHKPADVGTQARFDWTKLSGNEAGV